MALKNGVKSIQTTGYNGECMVNQTQYTYWAPMATNDSSLVKILAEGWTFHCEVEQLYCECNGKKADDLGLSWLDHQ